MRRLGGSTGGVAAIPAVCAVLFAGCHATSTSREPSLTVGRVATEGTHFVLLVDGRRLPFTPWGFNYDRTTLDGRDVLLEEVLAERPEKVIADFQAMREWGGNCARVFVATADILENPDTVHEPGLQRLETLLQAGERTGIRLILTGLANIRPGGAPAWIQQAGDDEMDRAEVLFWRTVARHCRGRDVVLAYDLQNEPAVHWSDDPNWTQGCFDMSGGQKFCYVHRRGRQMRLRWTRYIQARFGDEDALKRHWADYPRDGETWNAIAIPAFDKADTRFGEYFAFHGYVLSEWAERMRATIQAEDDGHLITVGALDPLPMASAVDFYCHHLYPEAVPEGSDFLATNVERWRKRLEALPPDKPLVMEEFYPLLLPQGIAMEQLLNTFLDATRWRASGWVSFYWGRARELNWPAPGFGALYEQWLAIWRQGRPAS